MSLQLLNDDLEDQIIRLAQREQRLPAAVVADALRLYEAYIGRDDQGERPAPINVLEQNPKTRKDTTTSFLEAIIGLGRSKETDVGRRADEILAAEIRPNSGWTLKDDEDPAR